MSKHEKYTRLKRQIALCLVMGAAMFSAAPMAFAATSVVANNQLPGDILSHIGNVHKDTNGNTMTITQGEHNAVIKWDKFDVGGSATVNFKGPDKDYNTLNYVSGGNMSQIYGTINATYGDGIRGGNIYIVNPSGVQIGNSAQINVGSLYVSTNTLDDRALNKFYQSAGNPDFQLGGKPNTDAELMSLGNINAINVTFEGNGRIVIDTERIKEVTGDSKLTAKDIVVRTSDASKLILGYDAYVDEDKDNDGNIDGYKDSAPNQNLATVYEGDTTKVVTGYMWVEDVEQLQAINTNLGGNYALRNSIDATGTASWDDNDGDGKYEGFKSIGVNADGKVATTDIGSETKYGFYGNFDGLGYNIFGLTINRAISNVGLFGVAHDANINNVTLVGGSITGVNVVGSVVGAALGNTHISNATNSASVTGNMDVGGIVGASRMEYNGNYTEKESSVTFTNLINTGSVTASAKNTGGLIGYMHHGTLTGNSYNLGNVSSKGHNVGGLVGHAINSTIGDGEHLVYNVLDVTGAYNVGGIVGNIEGSGSTVKNAENSGTVTATSSKEDTYTYHTGETNQGNLPRGTQLDSGVASITVNVANVGGIAGTSNQSVIENVTNSGDVSSHKQEGNNFYDAGNVGGIVGSAVDTKITNATNRENEVRGAHNVGGVAGYFGGKGTVTAGINDGGDIMATGARNATDFVKEQVRPQNESNEEFIIGNIGGIVGYMDGDKVYVTGSANRGTVHTSEPADPAAVKDWEKAANVGGVVGKIDRSDTLELKNIMEDVTKAAVSNSYNTGDVLGYTGVGGVVGMMYNGEVAGSYNLGYLRTTRQSTIGGSIDSLNMGGIVGDTTEGNGSVVLYDVYNKGQIGDSEFKYFGRHVGGIVGRLSGTVEKAYNTGAIYNGYNVVGGIAGWMPNGSIENSFNTGNITVVNNNNATSQVGGIVGAASANKDITINNVYNLGTLRSFKPNNNSGDNAIGGIVGGVNGKGGTVSITNAYTTGNIYAALTSLIGDSNKYYYDQTYSSSDNLHIGSIYSENRDGATIEVKNTYYIKPAKDENKNSLFTELTDNRNNSNKAIAFENKDQISEYQYDKDGEHYSLTFTTQSGGNVDGGNQDIVASDDNWRIYDDNTPILNAFLPKAEDYFYDKNLSVEGIGSIQYGTAYDPLLTIINAASGTTELKYNWTALGINSAAGIAVYGAGLTLNDFKATGGSGFFGGTIYADGALNINGNANNINIGSAADIYGSAVHITTDGKVTIYGDVTATGNGTTAKNDPDIDGSGSITINAGDVDVYGKLTSASDTQGSTVTIPGINDTAVGWTPGTIDDPYESMADIADRFAHTTGDSKVDGNITINAGTKLVVDENGNPILDADGNKQYVNIGDGNVNLYYGNKGEGLITSGGDLTVTGRGDVYVDSDLDIGGDMTLTSTGADSEVLLTLTNIGKVQADRFTDVIKGAINGKDINSLTPNDIVSAVNQAYPGLAFKDEQAGYIITALQNGGDNKAEALETLNDEIAVAYLHDFMHSFGKNTDSEIALKATSGNAKLTVDMWVENEGKYNFGKYDKNFPGTTDNHKFKDELDNLSFTVTNTSTNDKITDANKAVYVEVSTGEQLKGIQDYVNSGVENASDALGFNYALMGDINASQVENYEAIGGDNGSFTGTFDGRGNRVIGLKVTGNNAGIFSTVGDGGVVKDVNIYSGTFTGTTNAGSVAGVNNGRIEGVVTFGNTVTSDGNAGGIAGTNNGKGTFDTDGKLTGNGIYDVESTSSVIADSEFANAGGLVGTNDGALGNSFSDSAVTVATGNTLGEGVGLGGVVGVNKGDVQYVDSLGVTNGGDTGSSDIGGIIGINNGTMYSGYNESIVSGKDNVGGIIGTNAEGKKVTNVVNATRVTGDESNGQFVGGLVGANSGNVTNGRNNGEITGHDYVGGLVGENQENSSLKNLVNDSSAFITGDNYVGGIAGSNAGEITATNEAAGDEEDDSKLINRGTITGQTYVGGVVGKNTETGTITNTNNNIVLQVKDKDAVGEDAAKYFGGVVGENSGTIKHATNEANIIAEEAMYVGGIAGSNTQTGKLIGMGNSNEGNVVGNQFVGGVIGKNEGSIGNADTITTIFNAGKVVALAGGAGGTMAHNTGNITNVKMTNAGEVTGSPAYDKISGSTGGLIGYNEGKITDSVLENVKEFEISDTGGVVTGTVNVGGVIGYNKGDISTTTLRNTADITIDNQNGEKAQNIGGLIGRNEGTITGGRDDKGEYYKYQVYNNGTITVNGTGENVGGLIGYNAKNTDTNKPGSLDAAYNTGAIVANNSQNVGGIVGNNEGAVSQVFNTVLGEKTSILGEENVGGLIGSNSGSLNEAYNTTGVSGSSIVGNAVGVNSATGTITNILDVTNTGNTLIGYNQGKVDGSYTSATAEANGSLGITYISEKDKLLQDSYKNSLTDKDTWRFYDGYSTPLLKVFLTTLQVDGSKVDITYNAGEQDLNIGDLIYGNNPAIKAPDAEQSGPHDAFNGFGAYENTKEEGGLGESSLLHNTTGQKNAGRYDNWLFSQQIAASGEGDSFNPNNLGYDIVYTKDKGIEVKKATLDIVLDDISRVYGSGTISDGKNYGYTFGQKGSEMTEAMKKELASMGFEVTGDDAVENLAPGKTTNNVGDYTWSAKFELKGNLSDNYQFAGGSTLTGKSSVTKADLSIQANDENIALGGTPNFTGLVNQFVNGDSFNVRFGTDKDWTSTAGRHESVIGFWGDDGVFYQQGSSIPDTLFGGNYNVYFMPGTLTVGTMPDIPAWEFPGGRWDYLYNDAPFDRNRDFRERKAEINFVDGGMEI
ncbi:filamentous hemagglutinin N-terminal domain-containing protein [Megasphaera sp. SW808]|uniref:filamentous hemagglutinin N-terminal domain-containing protein n=1 Tax=Megasphaera sp. SW808 TaxID=2530045 RepID=UPI00143A02F7|nr:filamentous hemagglutinin N-terminal domain-containing protein [Megasphaera sp. SW808]NJE35597.1 filamentous hemagglutinin N-terminal domain-containing protein [Megasphaera sp. SW808]